MKSILFVLAIMMISFTSMAQKKLSAKDKQTDSIIDVEMITPLVDNAQDTPNWETFSSEVKAKYHANTAARAAIRAKIFYYYGKDWTAFTTNLVEYTDKYEDHSNAKLMNKNASMILEHSDNKTELQKALQWSKRAVDKDPSNEAFKKTYEELKEKLKNA